MFRETSLVPSKEITDDHKSHFLPHATRTVGTAEGSVVEIRTA